MTKPEHYLTAALLAMNIPMERVEQELEDQLVDWATAKAEHESQIDRCASEIKSLTADLAHLQKDRHQE